MSGPKEAILGVTWRCNSRCRICDIWKRKSSRELVPRAYGVLPSSLKRISLGGYGEPFMRGDLFEIVHIIRERCPRARIVVVTNGLSPKRILVQAKKMPKDIAIRVSLDGIGDIHDKVRGVKKGFEKARQTLFLLRENGFRDLGVGLVINKLNDSDIENVFAFSKDNKLSFACTVVQSSDITFGMKAGYLPHPIRTIEAIEGITGKLLKSPAPRDWVMAYFLDGLKDHLQGKPRRIHCLAGKEFFYMDPSGNIYPCNILSRKMGMLSDGHFPDLMKDNEDTLKFIDSCPRQCWMTCTVGPSMRKRPLGPSLWILKNYFLNFR